MYVDMHKGFTVIEISIAMVIMVILLSVGMVSYRGTLVTGRDKERDADVQAIAMYLESTYSREIKDSSGTVVLKKAGQYPARDIFNTSSQYDAVFADLDRSAQLSPRLPSERALTTNTNASTVQNISSSNLTPADKLSGANHYVYVPLVGEGSYTCISVSTDNCRSFKIFYRTESGDYKTIESKHK